MNKPMYGTQITKYATVKQATERYKIGRTKLLEVAKSENALVKIGRAVRVDVPKLDAAFETLYTE